MSAATELAEQEAARVEAEEAAAAELGELVNGERVPEPEPEPVEPYNPPAGEPTAKQLRDFEKEQVRHEAAVREIMADFAVGMVACDNCGGVGLTPPGPDVRTHPHFVECETCNGFGQVLTGSRRDGHTGRDCPACDGRGYLEALDDSGAPLAGKTSSSAGQAQPAPFSVVDGDGQGGDAPAPAQRYGVPTWMGDPSIGRS